MSEVFLGQIMLAGFNFVPRGFAQCNGQMMPINQNQALFSLLGTQFGGDGRTTFGLPDLRGRVPVGSGHSGDSNYAQGDTGGVESVTLLGTQMPQHAHALLGTTAVGGARNPAATLYGTSNGEALYGVATGGQVTMAAQSLGMAGNTLPHPNMQPYRVINFVIALSGIYPSRS